MIRASLVFCLLLLLSVATFSARAQSHDAQSPIVEVGAVVGPYSGLSLKYQNHATVALDFYSRFNTQGFFGARMHVLKQSPVESSPLTLFIGPGISGGVSDSAVFLGPAAEAGVFFGIDRYRIVLQIMPEIDIIPHLDGRLLAGVGLRISL